MSDNSPAPPSVVRHYATYLQAKTNLVPQITIRGATAAVVIGVDQKNLNLTFTRRKQHWRLGRIEVNRGRQNAGFAPGELTKAITALLGREPLTPAASVVSGVGSACANAALQGKRSTVIGM